jgi:adenylate kinase
MSLPYPGAVIFVGPPGSGKNTQADAFVDSHEGYFHFNTSQEIKNIFNDPKCKDDPAILMRKQEHDRGELVDPEWVIGIVLNGIKSLAGSGKAIVMSGSPRTLPEARKEIPLILDIYGNDSVAVIKIVVSDVISVTRNTTRRICSKCARPVILTPVNKDMAFCTVCGGELVVRKDDTKEIMRTRLREYHKRTEEIFTYLQAMGISIIEIDGEQEPKKVTADIETAIMGRFK